MNPAYTSPITLYTFLVEIDLIYRDRTIWRLVVAKDKNDAHEKIENFLINEWLIPADAEYSISVHSTIY